MTNSTLALSLFILISAVHIGCAERHSGSADTHLAPPTPAPQIFLGKINYQDLRKNVQILGPLGGPLARILAIEGKPVPMEDRHDYWSVNMAHNLFSVEKIDGKALSKPVWIQLVMPSGKTFPTTGQFSFEGYQDGGFVNVPDEAVAKYYDFPPQSNGRHFEVRFYVMEHHQ